MPLQELIRDRRFDHDTVAAMTAAYQCALSALGIKDRTDPATRLIAETIVSIFDSGVRDQRQLCEQTISAFCTRER